MHDARRRSEVTRPLVLLAAAGLVVSCVGVIDGSDTGLSSSPDEPGARSATGASGSTPGGKGTDPGTAIKPPASVSYPRSGLRRLSAAELRSTIKDLFFVDPSDDIPLLPPE